MPYSGIITKILLVMLLLFTGCRKNDRPRPAFPLPDFENVESLIYTHPDSAFTLLNKMVSYSEDSLTIASALNYMAIIQHDAGDYFGSLESLLSALKQLNPHKESDRYTLQAVLNLLGTNSLDLKDYNSAIRYYTKSLDLIEEDNFRQIVKNNLGVVFQKKGEYEKAIALFTSILQQVPDTTIEYARVLSNLAKTKWLENPSYLASGDLRKAWKIRMKKRDEWGLNASYAHLADYYAGSNSDSAWYFALNMYKSASSINSADDRLEALEKLISYSPPQESKSYFSIYSRLSDSVRTARTAAKNQFALIRYDAEKTKTENLELQKENAVKQVRLVRQKALLFSIIAVFLLLIVVGRIWYRKKQQQLIWTHQQKLKESQLKTSQKVHDVVANGLYRIMTSIEHNPDLNKSALLDEVEYLYEKSRNISYEEQEMPNQSVEFHQKISNLIKNFGSGKTKIMVTGNAPELWKSINQTVKSEIEQMVQELLINMKKHSQANRVLIKLERTDRELKIYYSDNGVGFPAQLNFGNGLRNTENRIIRLNGWFNFEKNSPNGLKIQIHLPVEHLA